jgi:hypothetical protein
MTWRAQNGSEKSKPVRQNENEENKPVRLNGSEDNKPVRRDEFVKLVIKLQ